jgi:hypothetical protein
MTYAQSFNLATPTGLEEANTIDEIIRNVKIALNERFTDILGVDLSSATDPQRVTKIVIPSAGMTIRNSTDAASLISITNSGASLASPTITGTMTATGATISGGTVAPTTLTVPSGTAITNASLTTPALVDAVLGGTTVNSGTISGGIVSPVTLTVPSGTTIPTHTETGTITATGSTRNGGTLVPTALTIPAGTVVALSNVFTGAGSPVSLGTTSTTIATTTLTAGTWLVITAGNLTISADNSSTTFCTVNTSLDFSGSATSTSGKYGVQGITFAAGSAFYNVIVMSVIVTVAGSTTVTMSGSRTTGCTANVAAPAISAVRIA